MSQTTQCSSNRATKEIVLTVVLDEKKETRNLSDAFRAHKKLLFGIAYRMLSSAEDAEDIVQDAFIKFGEIPPDRVQNEKALLISIVTRRSIDRLRSASRQKEEYIGPWLPEPLLASHDLDPSLVYEGEETLSTAFLLVLERLSPPERAVFLLRDVFDFDYAEISRILERTPEGCRKLNERARQRVREERKTAPLPFEKKQKLLEKFLLACRGRSLEELAGLLRDDVIVYADGGGRVSSALNPIYGRFKSARFFLGLLKKYKERGAVSKTKLVEVNGGPALLFYLNGKLDSITTMEFDRDRIVRIYSVRNPDKLSFVQKQISGSSLRVWLQDTRRKLSLMRRAYFSLVF